MRQTTRVFPFAPLAAAPLATAPSAIAPLATRPLATAPIAARALAIAPLAAGPPATRSLPAGLIAIVLALTVPSGLEAQVAGGVDAERRGGVQGVVRGAESDRPLLAVDIRVISVEGDRVVARGETGPNGAFTIDGLPAGEYVVEAVSIGYALTLSDPVTIPAGEDPTRLDIGVIRLEWEAIEVDGLSVVTDRPAVTFESDRSVYSMEGMPGIAGGSATDALSGVAELDVDIDGRVEFEGSTPEIYINGRPAPMRGEALAAYLEQFPADMIERIEVIPNPSARYAAEGTGGIVNIVLRRDASLGFSGNAFGNAGTRGEVGTGGRLSYQSGPWTLQSGGFLRHSNRETRGYDLRQNLLTDPETYRRQDRLSRNGGLSSSLDLSGEYRASESLLLRAQGRLTGNGSDADGTTTTTHFDRFMDASARYDRLSASDRDRGSRDFEAGFEWTPGEAGREITGEVSTDRGTSSGSTLLELRRDDDLLDEFDDALILPPDLQLRDEWDSDRRHQYRLDYTQPWGERGRVEAGYRGESRESSDDRTTWVGVDPLGPDEQVGFTHQERFNSGYVTLAHRLGDIRFQVGIRGEQATIRFAVPDQESFEKRYHSLFPTANLSWQPSSSGQLRLSYSQRIRRPGARIINPVDRSTDPLTRQVGNPEIDPQYSHSVRLDGRWSGQVFSVQMAPSYRLTTNDWVEIRSVQPDGVATESWANLGSSRRYGSTLTLSARPSSGWNGSIRLSGDRDFRDGGPTALDNGWTTMNWSVRGNLSARLTSAVNAQTQANWSPAREIPRGWVPSRLMTQAGVRMRLMEGRASLNLMVRDPFDLYDATVETRDPTHIQLGGTSVSRRSATVSFSYTFAGTGGSGGRGGGGARGGR